MATTALQPITDRVYTRAPYWADVPDEKWMDWRWQMANRLNSVEELGRVIRLTESEKKALSVKGLFRVDITPYFASLIDPGQALARSRARPPLSRPGSHAGHDTVCQLLPLLHSEPDRR